MTNIDVSIDRLTVVANENVFLTPVSYPNVRYLERLADNEFAVVYRDEDSEVVEQLAYINFVGKDGKCRVDFNPNRKLNSDIPTDAWKTLDLVLNGLVGNVHLTRFDIAFDVFDDRMARFRYYAPGLSRVYFARNSEIETIYYGSFKSRRQVRQYNKQVERMEKGFRTGPWWRLELQLRTAYIQDSEKYVLDLLQNFKKMDWNHLGLNDKILLTALDVRPELYAELSRDRKAKVNRLRREAPMDALVKEMLDIYEHKKSDLEWEIDHYTKRYIK